MNFTRAVRERKMKADGVAGKAAARAVAKALAAKRRMFKLVEATDWTGNACMAYLPWDSGECKLSKDLSENRFVVRMEPFGSSSRSWTLHGETRAFAHTAAWASEQWSDLTGESCPHAFISEVE